MNPLLGTWSKITSGKSAFGIRTRPVSTAQETGIAGKTLMTALCP
jgi:hypothetical protein